MCRVCAMFVRGFVQGLKGRFPRRCGAVQGVQANARDMTCVCVRVCTHALAYMCNSKTLHTLHNVIFYLKNNGLSKINLYKNLEQTLHNTKNPAQL